MRKNRKSALFQRRAHLLGTLVEDAGADQRAALDQLIRKHGRHADDDISHDIRHDHVVAAADVLGELRVAQRIAAQTSADLDMVLFRIFMCSFQAVLVDIDDGLHIRAEHSRRNGQNTRASAHIEQLV